jgi:hypothetical protein
LVVFDFDDLFEGVVGNDGTVGAAFGGEVEGGTTTARAGRRVGGGIGVGPSTCRGVQRGLLLKRKMSGRGWAGLGAGWKREASPMALT